MRWYISYPILAAGLAFGADVLFPGGPSVSRVSVAQHAAQEPELTSVQHPDHIQTVVLTSEIEFASRLAAFSPGAKILSRQAPQVSVLDYLAQKLSPLDFTPAVTTPATAQPISGATWKSVVVREAEPIYQQALVQERAVHTTRDTLARDIQTELRRVGCYVGEIDGVWGGGSKRAVLIFMDRINASLPTHDPDVFMLSLLKAQADPVCGETCPHGQSFTSNGRCVPTTLVAYGGKAVHEPPPQTIASETEALPSEVARVEPETPWQTVVAAAPVLVRPPTLYSGRMGIGGPKPADDMPTLTGNTAVPATQREGLTRTAALEARLAQDDIGTAPEQLPTLTTSSFDTDLADKPTRKRSKASASRSKPAGRASPSRAGNYRHVQRLFEHPLGRM
ncbi:hypothetical protein [Hyphomicrobium sp. LHD-15]|uniref:peptidoglycan-binding domain-containing protein n=1 Tax=Hyphomicrobium sp. LHD-15 TaxID=3072142 RepID=UPI00280E17A2|nr:hypothetical protein [Hyphomicrobium sp. LHD-15]MDQ8697278.1 hypothetical protein [Hyphomicrobium sp. LHD-15]